MKIFLLIFFLLNLSTINLVVVAESRSFNICPLCTSDGAITCPNGFEAACENETSNDTEPKCLFYGNKYVPGCWKFVEVKKLDLNFNLPNMPPSAMIEIIGGGDTYTLNREIIGCKKI